jgi:hypothetical protein
MIILARFGTTVCALVEAGPGIIDQFTVAHGGYSPASSCSGPPGPRASTPISR